MTTEEKIERKVICYVRASTTKQEIESQRADVMRTIYADGWTDDQVIEVGKKGASAVKVDENYTKLFNEMYEIMDSQNIVCVYAYAINRLVRNDEAGFVRFKNYLIDHKINLKTNLENVCLLDSNCNTNAGTEITLSVMALIAKDNAKELKEKTMRGRVFNRAKGMFVGGKVFYGYKTDEEKHFVIDDEKASVVRRIFDLYVNTPMSARQIGIQLFKEGILKQKHEHSRDQRVIKILRCIHYTGHEKSEDGLRMLYPPIIDDDIFEAAQKKLGLKTRLVRHRDNAMVCYGHGILRHNGCLMSVRRRAAAYTTPYDQEQLHISINCVDSLLLQLVADRYRALTASDREERIADLQAQAEQQQRIEENVLVQRAALDRKKDRLTDLYLEGNIEKEKYNKRLDEIREMEARFFDERIAASNRRFFIEAEIQGIQKQVPQLDIYSLNDEGRASAIRKVVKKIDVSRIEYNNYKFKVNYTNGAEETYECRPRQYLYWKVDGSGNRADFPVKIEKRFTKYNYKKKGE